MATSYCHPLNSVCLFLNAVAAHLDRHKFISRTLTESLLPASTRIVFKSAASDKIRDDALPIVAYSVGTITAVPYYPHNAAPGTTNGTAADLTTTLYFKVSTTNEALSAELAFEILQLSMSLWKGMQAHNFYIQNVQTSEVRRTHGSFFEATTTLQVNCGRPAWQHSNSDVMLREIGISLNLK